MRAIKNRRKHTFRTLFPFLSEGGNVKMNAFACFVGRSTFWVIQRLAHALEMSFILTKNFRKIFAHKKCYVLTKLVDC